MVPPRSSYGWEYAHEMRRAPPYVGWVPAVDADARTVRTARTDDERVLMYDTAPRAT
ncbi:hypothetical protein [Streptomyces sp. YIM 130001]|uniref:hypothetical protein n=1 Tax=Streptomyces sp. YIM 130001 TaxID=2259644 RepID=UPI0013C3F5C1|nr:hypothetical protein [Streptomyces sp. YIM 130001]